jgi:hypothetical protein
MPNKLKILAYLFAAVLFLLALLFLHDQLGILLVSLTSPEIAKEPFVILSEEHIRSQHVVLYGVIGIVLYFVLRSIELFLLTFNATQLIRYGHLAAIMIRWSIAFVFFDIVMQNWGGKNITFSNFAMQYQSIAGLIGIELYILRRFFVTKKR